MGAKPAHTGRPHGRPRRIDGPTIQPQLTQEDFRKLIELSELPEFDFNQAAAVRTAIRELYKSRFPAKDQG